jgi:hypothetical protein
MGMLCCRFGYVLDHCVLEDIVFLQLGSASMLLYLVVGGVESLHILPRYDL